MQKKFAMSTSRGRVIITAINFGIMRYAMGSTLITSSASICSLIFMVARLAAIAEPAFAQTIAPATIGAISRRPASETKIPTRFCPPILLKALYP